MRVLDSDPVTKTVRAFHYDVDHERAVIEDIQDVSAIVEANKTLRNMERPRNDVRRVASIPMNIFMELRRKGIVSDPKAFARWLNDPDNRAFRTSDARV